MASHTLPNTVRNTVGNGSVLLLPMADDRVRGPPSRDMTISGTFSIVISYANIFGFLSLYNLRNYQLSDVTRRFRPAQYTAAYKLTSAGALVLFLFILPFCGFDRYTILCCVAYLLFKYCETAMHYLFTYYQLAEQIRPNPRLVHPEKRSAAGRLYGDAVAQAGAAGGHCGDVPPYSCSPSSFTTFPT